MLNADLIWPIAASVVTGALIGAEREYRSSPAGIRTHILVSLSCCLLMLAATYQLNWIKGASESVIRVDPVRMAHGLLTGIGFLCGGVIFREGLTVRGLTTAASLWMTASLGVLFGIGLDRLAAVGTLATLLVLAAVTLTEAFAPKRRLAHVMVKYAPGAASTAQEVKDTLSSNQLRTINMDQLMDQEGMEYRIVVVGYTNERAHDLVTALSANASVIGFEIQAQQR